MALTNYPYLPGYLYSVKLTYGVSGTVTLARYQEFSVEETPTTKEANVAASREDEKVFLRKKLKLTFKVLRGLSNCYADLPHVMDKVTGIEIKLTDENGTVIHNGSDTGAPDFPIFTDTYHNLAVTEKRGKQDEGPGDAELVIESGIRNPNPPPPTP